jgi:hypothetical protein
MIEPEGDLLRFESLEIEADGLDAVRLSGTDVLLLAAAGHGQSLAAEVLDIADDGAYAAVEEPQGEVLVGEQGALLPGLAAESKDARPAKSLGALLKTHLEIVLAGIQGQQDDRLLALLQGLASGFVRGHGQELDLADAEVGVERFGLQAVNLLGSSENGLGDKGRALGPLFDPSPKELIERFGVQAPPPVQLV